MVIGVGAGQQNRVDCVKLAGRKSRFFRLKAHPQVLDLYDKFVEGVKRQDKVNAILKYVQNDFSDVELDAWRKLFIDENIPLLNENEIQTYLEEETDLCLSSDAFFPFRDNIDTANKFQVKYILQPGGSIQDNSVTEACNEYGMVMSMSGKRMFLH